MRSRECAKHQQRGAPCKHHLARYGKVPRVKLASRRDRTFQHGVFHEMKNDKRGQQAKACSHERAGYYITQCLVTWPAGMLRLLVGFTVSSSVSGLRGGLSHLPGLPIVFLPLAALLGGRQRHCVAFLVDKLEQVRVHWLFAGAQELDEVRRHCRHVAREEGEGSARAILPASPANPVRVHFEVGREVVVDDVRQALDVDTAAGDICGHEDLELASLELVQGPLALALVKVPVQSGA
mmetsp:Transcript_18590/g.53411  ORF Transcript_18590/g.53411 Transcript_18590/m.53411 type:complete len:237 (+) Transcript_18590:247-957(+)